MGASITVNVLTGTLRDQVLHTNTRSKPKFILKVKKQENCFQSVPKGKKYKRPAVIGKREVG